MRRSQSAFLILPLSLLWLSACGRGSAHEGSRVLLDYRLTIDGQLVEETDPGKPMEVVIGTQQILPALEAGLKGLRPGQEKTITLSPEQSYGRRDPTAIQEMPLTMFGALAKDLAVGRAVQGVRGGKPTEGLVVAINEKSVTLDFNHRLAGKTLVYNVKIVSVGDRQ